MSALPNDSALPGHRPARSWRALPAALAVLAVAMSLLGRGDFCAAAAAKAAPMTAILLIARADMQDDNFAGSVVLVMNNLGDGPMGLIVNRPTRIPVADQFPQLKSLAGVHDSIYFGGPVDLETIWFLFRAKTPPAHAIETCPGLYLSSSRTLLLSLLAREHPMQDLRIFAGHSGWAPGQLEGEITEGAWRLQKASSATIFSQTEHPWPASPAPGNGI